MRPKLALIFALFMTTLAIGLALTLTIALN